MRVLFLGTSDFAVPVLAALVESSRHDVLAVVTQPDRPQGRGQHVRISPVKQAALRYGLPLLQPRRVRSAVFLQEARDLAPDVMALAAFGQIIPQALLDLPPRGPINVHASLLPAYRGAAPIQYALLNGERETGVTTMWMDASLDTGDVLLARAVVIGADDTAGSLTARLAAAGAGILLDTLDLIEQGRCPRTPQDPGQATYAPPIQPEDGRIRWEEPAERSRNRVRAMSPRPGAYTLYRGRRVKVWAAAAEPGAAGSPGAVTALRREGVLVATADGALRLTEVQAENARRMAAADWARGARLAVGDRLA